MILFCNLSKKSMRVLFYFLFYIIFKVIFLLLFYLWIYDVAILNNQPMEFPKSVNETEKSKEEKLYETSIVYTSINTICLSYLLVFNFCLIYIDKILISNLDLIPNDLESQNVSYIMYPAIINNSNNPNNIYYNNNTNNANYITSSIAIMNNRNQTNNPNNNNNSISEEEKIKKTSIFIGEINVNVQFKTDKNIYLEENITKKNIYLNKYY